MLFTWVRRQITVIIWEVEPSVETILYQEFRKYTKVNKSSLQNYSTLEEDSSTKNYPRRRRTRQTRWQGRYTGGEFQSDRHLRSQSTNPWLCGSATRLKAWKVRHSSEGSRVFPKQSYWWWSRWCCFFAGHAFSSVRKCIPWSLVLNCRDRVSRGLPVLIFCSNSSLFMFTFPLNLCIEDYSYFEPFVNILFGFSFELRSERVLDIWTWIGTLALYMHFRLLFLK